MAPGRGRVCGCCGLRAWQGSCKRHRVATTDHISMLQILSLQLNAFKCIFLLPQPLPERGRGRERACLQKCVGCCFAHADAAAPPAAGHVEQSRANKAGRLAGRHTLRMRNAARHAINSTIKGHQLKRASAQAVTVTGCHTRTLTVHSHCRHS